MNTQDRESLEAEIRKDLWRVEKALIKLYGQNQGLAILDHIVIEIEKEIIRGVEA